MLMAHSEVLRAELEESKLAEKTDVPVDDIFTDTLQNLLKLVDRIFLSLSVVWVRLRNFYNLQVLINKFINLFLNLNKALSQKSWSINALRAKDAA